MNRVHTLVILGAIVAAFALIPNATSADKPVLHAFSLEACYATCGCDAVGMVQACFDCKQECNRKYWAEFDRETGDDKTRKDDEDN